MLPISQKYVREPAPPFQLMHGCYLNKKKSEVLSQLVLLASLETHR